ncbi:Ribosomal RNA-processing protein 7 A [Rhizoclosmatium sp. JEL0117]|nr:Ribosomal RNA-processing protein 7 A [Rhizoclosmatium sp. JEL0117]
MADTKAPLLAVQAGFHVLPVSVGAATHTLLFKRHSGSTDDDEHPTDRTLFVANVPVDASEAHVRRLFRRCGPIASVSLSRRAAHVVFEDPESLLRAEQMRSRRRVWSAEVDDAADSQNAAIAPHLIGLEKWIKLFVHNHPPLATLQQQANEYMRQYDHLQNERQKELARRRAEPDEDGFILVGAHKQAKKADDSKDETEGGNRKKKPKKIEHVDFYRFQMRESKRNQLVELRNKFEEDKKRIEKLKATRKFKPY